MKHPHVAAVLCLLLCAAVGLVTAQTTQISNTQSIFSASYIYPTCWNRTSAGCQAWDRFGNDSQVVIINPSSGPGTAVNSDYSTLVNTIRSRTKRPLILGYVATTYAKKSIATVRTEINNYVNWYKVDGFFFDEGSSSCTQLNYTQLLVVAANTSKPGAMTVLNWGWAGNECFLSGPNQISVFVNFESNYTSYKTWSAPAWVRKYSPARFWHIAYGVPATELVNAINQSRRNWALNIYFTHASLPNPYNVLPTFWSTMVSYASIFTHWPALSTK